MTGTERGWLRPALVALAVLVALAPVFAWAATQVGYTEPLELAAEAAGVAADPDNPGLLPDYGVSGLPGPLGTLLSAVVGTALVLVVGFGAGRLLAADGQGEDADAEA